MWMASVASVHGGSRTQTRENVEMDLSFETLTFLRHLVSMKYIKSDVSEYVFPLYMRITSPSLLEQTSLHVSSDCCAFPIQDCTATSVDLVRVVSL